MKTTKTIKSFCESHRITIDQFYGRVKVDWGLDLQSVTTLPEGFNPTVGGYLYLQSGAKHIGSETNKNFFWDNGYAKIDGIFCKIHSMKSVDEVKLISASKVNGVALFIAKVGDFYAHGDSFKSAIEDAEFKAIAKKLKHEPIEKTTIITDQYYRIVTGACKEGVEMWKKEHGITATEITAEKLLPILEKSNAYGVSRFKELINW